VNPGKPGVPLFAIVATLPFAPPGEVDDDPVPGRLRPDPPPATPGGWCQRAPVELRHPPGRSAARPSSNAEESPVPTIVVDVMPKAELLDPQGKAIAAALGRTGRGTFDVRQGKRFELTTDAAVSDELLASVQEIATEVLSNGVIEDVVGVHVVEDAARESQGA
jgi:phosphoribosylformylglycinamidine synthase